MNVVKFLANLIFKKQIQKQKGIMKILPGDKVDAEKKAEAALKKLEERGNININNLKESDLEFIAEDIVNPFKYAEKTPIKSADILPFRFKRSFAEELADASKKGDFTRMSGIMKLDPKFKEVIKAFNKLKADEKAYKEMVGPKKLIPDRDVIPYQSPEVQKLSPKEKLARTTLTEDQYKDVLKKGYGIDDVIYAQDFYGDTAEDVIRRATEKGTPVAFAGGGVAGLLGERVNFAGGGINKARRLFLQAIGAGAAGIGAAKTGLLGLLKGAGKKNLTSIPIENAEGMPSWFKPLVNRVIKEGTETTNLPPNKGGAYLNRQIVHSAKLGENQGVRVYQNLDDQTIDVVYKSADNMGGVDDGVVTLEYRAPQDLYDTGPESVMSKEYQATKKASGQYPKKSAAEFEAHEAYPYQDPEDYKSITFEAQHIKSNVDDLFSDTSALKQFGTNKTLTKKELEIAKQKRQRVKKINEDPYGEELAGSGPDYDPYDDYADGGVAGLLGERPGYKSGLSVLGLTPEHNAAVVDMQMNPGKYGIGSQFDYAAESTKDMVDRASNPLTAVASAVGNVVGRPAYDFVDAAKEYSKKGYQGEFSLSPQGAIDFGKNMLGLGTEFLNQKPGTMMGGALKGGIQSLGTQLGESIYDKVNPEEEDEYDFSDIEGQTAGLGIVSGIKAALSKFVGPKAAAFIVKRGKDKIRSDIGEKVITPTIKKIKNKKSTTRPSSGGGGNRSFDTSRADRAGTSLGSGQFSPQTSRGRSGYTEGGVAGLLDKRQNFAMGRRAFLKLMGSVGAGIGAAKAGLGSLFKAGKPVTKAAEVITTPNAPGKPEWFDALVTRVIREGDDVTKKFATKEREIVHTTKIDENATVTVTRDLDEGIVRVDIDDPFTNVADDQGNAIVSMQVKGGRLEEGVKGKTPAEFEAVETDYGNYMDGPDDFITEAVENTVSDTKDLTADLTKVKMYAKGQKKPTIKEMMIQRERARDLKLAEENPTEYASGRQPDIDYSDYDDYASGGVARMLGE